MLLMHSSVLSNLLLIASYAFFISVSIFFSSDWFFLCFLVLGWSSHWLPLFVCQSQCDFFKNHYCFELFYISYFSLFPSFYFLGFYLVLHLEHIPVYFQFLWLSLILSMKWNERVSDSKKLVCKSFYVFKTPLCSLLVPSGFGERSIYDVVTGSIFSWGALVPHLREA